MLLSADPVALGGLTPHDHGGAAILSQTTADEGEAGTISENMASIHGIKWQDTNGNSRRDADEPGLPGVTIYLDLNFNNEVDDDEPFAVTGQDISGTPNNETGRYWIDVEPGFYLVREVVPDGFEQTFPHVLTCRATFCVGRAHLVNVEAGDRIDGLDFGNQPIRSASVHGTKWVDRNGNAERDPNEPGLADVTIYADANNNRRLDDGEVFTETMRDDPTTHSDEAGMYWLHLDPGRHVIREVVPDGFVQTFPLSFDPADEATADEPGGEFATVNPGMIDVTLAAGEVLAMQVSMAIHPFCFRPYELDVMASDPDAILENTTGVLVNGCGGDTSTFDIELTGDGVPRHFELQFVDVEFGGILDVIPVWVSVPGQGGAHVVELEPGDRVEGIDFGNQPVRRPSVHGIKWEDLNRNGRRDPGEPGLGGVTVFADDNNNGMLDDGEPFTVTMEENPFTDFDEGGLYWLTLEPGRHVIRELVPDGFVQTFPGIGPSVRVLGSETTVLNLGIALDYDLTGARVVPNSAGTVGGVELEMTVVWPDSCGALITDLTTHSVANGHISVDMFGYQVGDICALVISPESQAVRVGALEPGHYTVSATLHEELRDGTSVPTLLATGRIIVGPSGGHVVELEPGDIVEGIDFGNHELKPDPTEVVVSGSEWTEEFLLAIDPGRGLGFSVRDGHDGILPLHRRTLPWGNVDRFSLVFDQDVDILQSDMWMFGLNMPDYGELLAAGGFNYDPTTFTATWSFPRGEVMGNDKVLLVLVTPTLTNGGDPAGAADIALTNEFLFRINFLPGDATGNGKTILDDLDIVARNFNKNSIWGDFNGDHKVLLVDLGILAKFFNMSLPPGQPTIPVDLTGLAGGTEQATPAGALMAAEHDLRTRSRTRPAAYRPPLGLWDDAEQDDDAPFSATGSDPAVIR